MDYVRLRAAIQEYSEDFEASFVDNIDTFIRLAESRILLRVRLPNFRKDATGSVLLGEALIATPSDFLAPDYLAVTEVVVSVPGAVSGRDSSTFASSLPGLAIPGESLPGGPPPGPPPVIPPVLPPAPPRRAILLNKDPEFIRECYPERNLGLPRFYSMINETSLAIGPGADANYTVDMAYFFEPPSIVDSGTTWLGDHFSHALLSGSLVEACTYMKTEDNLYQRYDQAFEKDLAMDQQYAKGRTRKDTYQEPDVRAKV